MHAREEVVDNQYVDLDLQEQAMEAYADLTVCNPDGQLGLEMAMGELRSYLLEIVNERWEAGFITEKG